jgi:hypothetical protein
MKPKESKIFDHIFTEAALAGVNLDTMNIKLNDNDFTYVMNRYCSAHKMLLGTLYTRDEVTELANRNGPPHLSCVMYSYNPVAGRLPNSIEFVHFSSPVTMPNSAQQTLEAIHELLKTNFGISFQPKIQPMVAPKTPPEIVEIESKGALHPEYIASKQPYFEMSLSADDTAKIRDQMQEHLDRIRTELQDHSEMKSTKKSQVVLSGSRVFPVTIKNNDTYDRVVISSGVLPMNEQQEAKFSDMLKDMIAYGKKHDPDTRLLTDGKQLMIAGDNAYNLLRKMTVHLDEKPSPAPPAPVRITGKGYEIPPRPAIKAAVPVADPLDDFLSKPAFKAIRNNGNALFAGDVEHLNEEGIKLQQHIVGALKGYFATHGINSFDELKASTVADSITEHLKGINHHFTKMESPATGLTTSILQNAMISVLKDIKLAKKNIRPEGHGDGAAVQ